MFSRPYHRRPFGTLPSAAERSKSPWKAVIVLVILAVIAWAGWKGLQAIGLLNQVRRERVDLVVTSNPVNMSLEGGELRPADTAKLYAEDRVVSNSGGRATLSFFDGSRAGLDEVSDVTITDSRHGTKSSYLSLLLTQGRMVLDTPLPAAFTGSITRTIETPRFVATFPSNSRAIVTPVSIQVLAADGLGVSVEVAGEDEAVIGEGQQLVLPEGDLTGSVYDYRSTIDLAASRTAVSLLPAKVVAGDTVATGSGSQTLPSDLDAIVVSSPADDAQVTGSTVRVQGIAGAAITKIRINGYEAQIAPEDGTFTQELAVSTGPSMTILIEGLDQNNVVISQQQRTVRIGTAVTGGSGVAASGTPAITFPAKEGSVYRTNATKLEIRGTAPTTAAGIMVNDYKLQLFKAGDTSWTYLANADLGNLPAGRTDFTVWTLDATGNKGGAVTITILREEGPEGIVTGATSPTASSTSSAPQISETTLPSNAPLNPGTLTVTAPQAGTTATVTTNDVLIEGSTSSATDSIWVNGYKLQLYKSGATFWNYYARESIGTLKRGRNSYVVNARNAQGQILDTITYIIEY